ncbi:MAG: hypothetical protein HDS72_07085 [Bacteroidales bacterium]|nr:hypothetical protein [Bacteroidales bacterium]
MIVDSNMIGIIKIAVSFIGGLASYGLIQFFINRNDDKKKERNLRYNAILERIAEYGKGINKSLNIWYENFHTIIELLNSYIANSKEYRENVKFLFAEYKDIVEEAEKHVCKFAQLCPRRQASSELPKEVIELCDKTSMVTEKYDSLNKEINNKIIEFIQKIESPLSGFEDILNSFPEVYSLPRKAHTKIFAQLSKIQIMNSNLLLRISEIKSDPINKILSSNITKNDDSLGDMLVKIIKEVESTKIMIAEFIR